MEQFQQLGNDIRNRPEGAPVVDVNKNVEKDNDDKVPNQIPLKNSTVHMREKKSLLPGGVYDIKLNSAEVQNEYVAVLPQFHKHDHPGPEWKPQICKIEDGCANYENNSEQTLHHPKGVHFHTIAAVQISNQDLAARVVRRNPGPKLSAPCDMTERLSEMKINKKIMTDAQLIKLEDIHTKNYKVFDDDLTDGYVEHEARINLKK